MQSIKCQTIDQLKNKIDSFRKDFKENKEYFTKIYRFTFDLYRDEKDKKVIVIENARGMIQWQSPLGNSADALWWDAAEEVLLVPGLGVDDQEAFVHLLRHMVYGAGVF